MEENKNVEVNDNNSASAQIGSDKDDFVVIREQIKSRPINKAKLIRNTMVAALSAVVFGIVACFTFFLLAPIVSGYLKEEEEVKPANEFIFPVADNEEEMLPEDMLIKEPETEIDFSKFSYLEEDEVKSLVEGVVNQIEFSVADYQKLYQKLSVISYDFKKSMVQVGSYSNETDWMKNYVENESNYMGLIVAENDNSLYVLTYKRAISDEDKILVTFSNTYSTIATLIASDTNTGLCILEIENENMNEVTLNYIEVAVLGSSKSNYLAGTPIIALGSPMGSYGSFGYGMVTSNGTTINMPDYNYSYITTDINGSSNATGVVINLKGYVIGMIDQNSATNDMKGIISIIGITELKKNIENMINKVSVPTLGIKAVDVPAVAQLNYDVPVGVYVLSVEMGSPAMNSGIQSGDILASINNKVITDFDDFYSILCSLNEGEEITINAYRQSQDQYKEIQFTVVLGQSR